MISKSPFLNRLNQFVHERSNSITVSRLANNSVHQQYIFFCENKTKSSDEYALYLHF